MSTQLLLVQSLNGLQLGVILFLIAAGLTLVFGVMDFINLAHGVQYMVGAYLAAMFVAWTGNFWLGLALTLPTALAFGLVLEWAIFRRLYGRDPLDQILATFGIILFVDQGVKTLWGAEPLSVPIPEALQGGVRLMDGLLYPIYRIALIVVGLAVALGLYFLVNHTRVGMRVRAGASNAPMISALGVDIRRLFSIVFGFGAMLAGLAGALVAPILSVEPGMGDSVLILAFVVIVIGGVGSIRGAFLGALLVGLIDTFGHAFGPQLLRLAMSASAASQTGRSLAPMLIYVLMAGVLFFRPTGLFPVEAMRVAPIAAGFLLLALAPLAARFGPEAYLLNLASRALVFAIAAMSLEFVLGQAGLISFGHAAYLGIGAYAVAILSLAGCDEILIQVVVAMAAAALFALATGAVSLRASGVYYIMSTLAFGQMLYFLAVSLSAFGGDDGVTLDARPNLAGSAVLSSDRAYYYLVLAALVLAYLALRCIVGSRFGRVLGAIRQNPLRVRALGFDPFGFRLTACAISGAVCAVAGVLLANQNDFVSPAFMTWQRSGELIVMTAFGGVGSLGGAVIGALAFLLLSEWLSTITQQSSLLLGPLLVLVALYGRGGLTQLAARVARRPA